ncbi:ribosome-binding factor A [Patescibacteria group bacterium]|nr:ribosome-binding factor A [Patescibacteria group bacterium]
MKDARLAKLNKELTKTLAEFIERESNKQSMVTVTRCDISPDLKNVIVYISVFPTDHEHAVIEFLNRRKWDARDFMKKRIITRVVPFIEFHIDYGEKNRQHVDQLLKADNVGGSKA